MLCLDLGVRDTDTLSALIGGGVNVITIISDETLLQYPLTQDGSHTCRWICPTGHKLPAG